MSDSEAETVILDTSPKVYKRLYKRPKVVGSDDDDGGAIASNSSGLEKYKQGQHTRTHENSISRSVSPNTTHPSNLFGSGNNGQVKKKGLAVAKIRGRSSSPVVQRKVSEKRDANGRSRLQRCCDKGKYEEAQSLIMMGMDVNDRDYAGLTPLHEAALKGHDDIVEMLLKHGAIADIRSGVEDLDTPLIDAVANGHLGVARLLVKAGADSRIVNIHGKTALDFLDEDDENYEELKKVLVSRNSALHAARSSSDPSIHMLSYNPKFSKIGTFPHEWKASDNLSTCLDDGGSGTGNNGSRSLSDQERGLSRGSRGGRDRNDLLWMDLTSKSGKERFAQKAGDGDVQFVGTALQNGFRPDGESLAAAAQRGHTEIVNLMLAFGAKVDQRNHDGETALISTVGKDYVETLRLLLDAGANPLAKRASDGKSALELARLADKDEYELLSKYVSSGKRKDHHDAEVQRPSKKHEHTARHSESKEVKDSKDAKEIKGSSEMKVNKDSRDAKELRATKTLKEWKESRLQKEKASSVDGKVKDKDARTLNPKSVSKHDNLRQDGNNSDLKELKERRESTEGLSPHNVPRTISASEIHVKAEPDERHRSMFRTPSDGHSSHNDSNSKRVDCQFRKSSSDLHSIQRVPSREFKPGSIASGPNSRRESLATDSEQEEEKERHKEQAAAQAALIAKQREQQQEQRRQLELQREAQKKERESQMMKQWELEMQRKEQKKQEAAKALREQERIRQAAEAQQRQKALELEAEQRKQEQLLAEAEVRKAFPSGIQFVTYGKRTIEQAQKYLPLMVKDVDSVDYVLDLQVSLFTGVPDFMKVYSGDEVEVIAADKKRMWNVMIPWLTKSLPKFDNVLAEDVSIVRHADEQKFMAMKCSWIKLKDVEQILLKDFPELAEIVRCVPVYFGQPSNSEPLSEISNTHGFNSSKPSLTSVSQRIRLKLKQQQLNWF